jgi:hypothetical protein
MKQPYNPEKFVSMLSEHVVKNGDEKTERNTFAPGANT